MNGDSEREPTKGDGIAQESAPVQQRRRGAAAVFHVLGLVLRAPLARRTRAEMVYVIVGAVLALVAFVCAIALLFGSGMLLVTLVGLPLLGLTVLAARWIGAVQRRLVQALLNERIEPPHAFRSEPGFFGWLRGALLDGTGWLAILYLVIKTPLAVGTFSALASFWGFGIFNLTHPIWWGLTPALGQETGQGNFNLMNLTWHQTLALAPAGLACILAAPWVGRGLVWLDLRLMHLLLGRRRGSARERELEVARARVADDSAARLRQIERDLHDGAQVRLTALAMALGQIREDLAEDADAANAAERTRELVESAHQNAKDAIVELRDLVRGIHPPALDMGLDTALATLVANTAAPVRLSVDVPTRPSPTLEAIVYFCAAELLTNVVKHSGAAHASLQVDEEDGKLLVRVSDDGSGGAALTPGGGLAGLADRVRTVDGTLSIQSPVGGPTVVSIELPLQI